MFLCCLVGCRITPPDIGDPVEVSVIFQVTDFRTEIIVPPVEVGAASPEAAAREAVFRSGHRLDLVAWVYWQSVGGKTMVRPYGKGG